MTHQGPIRQSLKNYRSLEDYIIFTFVVNMHNDIEFQRLNYTLRNKIVDHVANTLERFFKKYKPILRDELDV